MRALVAGWFSFSGMGATAGDLMAADVVTSWLQDAGCAHDRAVAPEVGEGVDALSVDPRAYTHVVFVCGPLGQGEPATTLFDRFPHARLIGVDLSMLAPLEEWNPFHLLLERDSSRTSRPDIALMAETPLVPVVAVVLVHEQKEYDAGRHRQVHRSIQEAVAASGVASLPVDTCFDPPNQTGLTTPAQVLSMLARVDLIVTTRLHGLVLGLKVGVPVVAIDPVAGGAKVRRQAEALGWNLVLDADEATPTGIRAAMEVGMRPESRVQARRCALAARPVVDEARRQFLAELGA